MKPKISSSLKASAACATVLLATALGGCETLPQTSGYVQANQDDIAAVARGEYSPRATANITIVQNPDVNGGIIPKDALAYIERYAVSCQWQVNPQQAGPGQSTASGLLEGPLPAAGTGGGAGWAFKGADVGQYTQYALPGYILAYGENALRSGSYGGNASKGECTGKFWDDKRQDDTHPNWYGTHVLTNYSGKSWGDSTPPALTHKVDPVGDDVASHPDTSPPATK